MKYSQLAGIFCALALIGSCFVTWSYIPSKSIDVSGLHAVGTSFGRPGLLHLLLSGLAMLLFLVPRVWAKRTNLFVAALNLAWSIRNYWLVTACLMGECPEKRAGIYLLLLFSLGMLLMTFFPRIDVQTKNEAGTAGNGK